MAADTIVTGSKLTAIANAIRARTGGSSQLTLDDMPTEIAAIPGGGGGGTGVGAAKAQVVSVFASGALGSDADLVVTAADLQAAADKLGNINLDTLAFWGCEWLTKITIPSGAYVGPCALSACPNLQEIEILGELVYSYSSKKVPTPYSNLPSGAPFCNNPLIESLDLSGFRPYGSSGNKSLPSYLCYANLAMTSLTWPTDTRWAKLGNYALAGTLIASTTVPANFTEVPSSAFGAAGSGVTLYNSLEEITFKGNITTITASNYSEPFQTGPTPTLRRVVFEGNTAVPALTGSYLFYTGLATRSPGHVPAGFEGIYVPDALLASWKAANNWDAYASVILPLSDLPAAS